VSYFLAAEGVFSPQIAFQRKILNQEKTDFKKSGFKRQAA